MLYGVGALERATQIHGAHLRVLDFLPLTSLPDLLATGISETVRYVLAILLWVVLFGLILWWVSREDSADGRPGIHIPNLRVTKRPREPSKRLVWPLRATGSLLRLTFAMPFYLLAVFLLECLFLNLAAAAATTVAVVAGSVVAQADRKQRTRALAIGSLILVASVAAGLANSYYAPSPLPWATIRTSRGTVSGSLVAHVDSTWYVSRHAGRVVSIPDSQAVAVAIVSRPEPKPPRAGWQVITSWF